MQPNHGCHDPTTYPEVGNKLFTTAHTILLAATSRLISRTEPNPFWTGTMQPINVAINKKHLACVAHNMQLFRVKLEVQLSQHPKLVVTERLGCDYLSWESHNLMLKIKLQLVEMLDGRITIEGVRICWCMCNLRNNPTIAIINQVVVVRPYPTKLDLVSVSTPLAPNPCWPLHQDQIPSGTICLGSSCDDAQSLRCS